MLADNIQSSNLTSFEKIESYLSQDLLRVTSSAKNNDANKTLMVIDGRPTKNAFEVARNMVMCWVNAGYSYSQLWTMVSASNAEDILPPRDPNDNSGFFIGHSDASANKYLAHKFINQFKKMSSKSMNDRQIDYVVWKSLLYVMRGCGKMLNTSSAASNYNVSYNYLPPGLREMEQRKLAVDTTADKYYPNDLPTELSEDPLNIIIDPHGLRTSKKATAETMPRRKYFVCAIHLEFIMFKGKAEIYEIGVYCQDLSSLELYIVPEALKNDLTTLEALGFTLNKNLNKYFYVQSGMGCVGAMNWNRALERLIEFLEHKRLATEENQNNGLVLLCKNQQHLAALLTNVLSLSDLTLNTIKAFGLLDSVCQLGETQINLVGNDCCLSAQVIANNRFEEVMAKTKAELLFKGLEAGLQVSNPGYDSFVQPHCFPSDGHRIKSVKTKAKQLEDMYDLEIFVSAELKANNVKTFFEGIYSLDKDQKDVRHKSDIVAHKFCQALVEANLDMDTLRNKFQQILNQINPELILNQMDKPQRLKVFDQTLACFEFVRKYFRSSQQQ